MFSVLSIGKLTLDQLNEVSKLGFDDLLKFNLESLEIRGLLCFLMDRIDPTDMVLHVSGGKSISITPHVVKCVLGLPYSGRDALMVSLAASIVELAELKRLLRVP